MSGAAVLLFGKNPQRFFQRAQVRVPEERDMRNWWKHNKKLMNAGTMKEDRVALFNQLLELGEKYRRVNQYE